jgi:DNA-binding NtrC family response regulator
VTGFPEDLADLHGLPEQPVLVIAKPAHVAQIDEALRLALRPALARRGAALVAHGDAALRSLLRRTIERSGHEVEECDAPEAARAALRRRWFGHAFLDPSIDAGASGYLGTLANEYPETVLIMVCGPGGWRSMALERLATPVMVLPTPLRPEHVRVALRFRLAPLSGE